MRYRSTFYFEGQQYESSSSKSQSEADKKAALKLDKLKRGEIGISSNMTVSRWANEWLETYKKPVLGTKQYKSYQSMIKNTINPTIGAMRITDVKDIHLQKIVNSKAGQSRDTLVKLKSRINSMFRQAIISKLIIHNPAEHLTIPKAEDGTHRSITDFEREHFLKAAATHKAGLMFKVMLYCGLRTGEVVALEWRDIDFAKRRIKVSRAMEAGTNNIKTPKTKAGIREVPIPDVLYDELVAVKGEPFQPMFTHSRDARHSEASRRRAWRSLKEEINKSMGAVYEKRKAKDGKMRLTEVLSVVAPDFVPYCLRHTYCTDLQNKGVPINIAKYLMGHANISVTAKIYTHTTEETLDTAAALINSDNGKHNGKQKA